MCIQISTWWIWNINPCAFKYPHDGYGTYIHVNWIIPSELGVRMFNFDNCERGCPEFPFNFFYAFSNKFFFNFFDLLLLDINYLHTIYSYIFQITFCSNFLYLFCIFLNFIFSLNIRIFLFVIWYFSLFIFLSNICVRIFHFEIFRMQMWIFDTSLQYWWSHQYHNNHITTALMITSVSHHYSIDDHITTVLMITSVQYWWSNYYSIHGRISLNNSVNSIVWSAKHPPYISMPFTQEKQHR